MHSGIKRFMSIVSVLLCDGKTELPPHTCSREYVSCRERVLNSNLRERAEHFFVERRSSNKYLQVMNARYVVKC